MLTCVLFFCNVPPSFSGRMLTCVLFFCKVPPSLSGVGPLVAGATARLTIELSVLLRSTWECFRPSFPGVVSSFFSYTIARAIVSFLRNGDWFIGCENDSYGSNSWVGLLKYFDESFCGKSNILSEYFSVSLREK